MKFGTDVKLMKEFIRDLMNLEVDGFKMCGSYDITCQNASVHALNFLWNTISYKVDFHKNDESL